MPRLRPLSLWRTVKMCALGVAGVAMATYFGYALHLSFTTASFCYLLLLVLLSLGGDFISSALISLVAVGCLDYFFTEPVFSFEVMSEFDLLGLISFLVTGLVITGLVAKVRAGTEASLRQREKMQGLYDLAQQLLALEPDSKNGSRFLEVFRGAFGICSVCLFDATGAELHIAGDANPLLEKKTGEAFIHAKGTDDAESRISTRCIRVGGRTIGAIGFEGIEDPELTAGSLAALAAAHIERTHSFVHASRAAATVQTESYRSAILDALAHEFKTPLSTILAAAGALREGGSLGPHQREMAETVESEASRLGRLTSRLIRTARLEREEVKPWMELIDVSSVIAETVEQYSTRLAAERRIRVLKQCDSSAVMADPELLRLAVSKLLDNACKYSEARSTITLSIGRDEDNVSVLIHSSGNPIPSGERSKIFDRFYRGLDGKRLGPGSGLGLFVARKIAVALGGSLDLDNGSASAEGSVFRLALPIPESERDGIAAAL